MAVLFMVFSTLILIYLMKTQISDKQMSVLFFNINSSLFPSSKEASLIFISVFTALTLLNLVSLVCFSYPVTTTLSFNFSAAFILWGISIFILLNKKDSFSSFLPLNSPWYLVPFLSLVELVSIVVRPITLCFRLLANMSAGHILLALICKLKYSLWLLGVLFSLLELMVSVVQSFVFLMLVSVYLEEATSHCPFSY